MNKLIPAGVQLGYKYYFNLPVPEGAEAVFAVSNRYPNGFYVIPEKCRIYAGMVPLNGYPRFFTSFEVSGPRKLVSGKGSGKTWGVSRPHCYDDPGDVPLWLRELVERVDVQVRGELSKALFMATVSASAF